MEDEHKPVILKHGGGKAGYVRYLIATGQFKPGMVKHPSENLKKMESSMTKPKRTKPKVAPVNETMYDDFSKPEPVKDKWTKPKVAVEPQSESDVEQVIKPIKLKKVKPPVAPEPVKPKKTKSKVQVDKEDTSKLTQEFNYNLIANKGDNRVYLQGIISAWTKFYPDKKIEDILPEYKKKLSELTLKELFPNYSLQNKNVSIFSSNDITDDTLTKYGNEFFINNKAWYDEKGIPYTLGLLHSGNPGTGKTSTLKCLANETKRHIFNINFNNDITKYNCCIS
jgi:tRNA uridine 5-carbamoylmethylation protein Kti12